MRPTGKQRRGPYRRWVHAHAFVAERGTLVRDDVEFEVRGGATIGWFVARDLRTVFRFRHQGLLRPINQPRPWPEPRIEIA